MSERKIERTFIKDVPPPSPYYRAARAHAEIGFIQLGTQDPYFHVLAGVEGKLRNNRWEGDLRRFACCADHDALRKHFPAYAHLVKWHLCSITSGPTHYEENAIYHAEQGDVAAFKSTTCFGALDTDGGEPWLLPAPQLRDWLSIRLPALMATFQRDVEEAFPGMWDAALALVVKER